VIGDSVLDEPEQLAWRTFLAAHTSLVSHLQQHLERQFKLSAADYEILARLAETSDQRMPVAEMAAATMWETSRLSHQLTRMEDRGLIRREDSTTSRYRDIALTAKGHATITEAAPAHAAMVRAQFIDVLGPCRLQDFAEACATLRTALESHKDSNCSVRTPADPRRESTNNPTGRATGSGRRGTDH
jgi:DNA-binding MarR family transcriptional regulator